MNPDNLQPNNAWTKNKFDHAEFSKLETFFSIIMASADSNICIL